MGTLICTDGDRNPSKMDNNNKKESNFEPKTEPKTSPKTEPKTLTLADMLAIKDATQHIETAPSTNSGYSQASAASSTGSNSKNPRVKHICLEEKIIAKYPSDILKKRQISHIQGELAGGKTVEKPNLEKPNFQKPNFQTTISQTPDSKIPDSKTQNYQNPNFQPSNLQTSNPQIPRSVSPLIPLDTEAEIQHKDQCNKSYDSSLISMTKSSQQIQITKLSPRDPKQVSTKKLGEGKYSEKD